MLIMQKLFINHCCEYSFVSRPWILIRYQYYDNFLYNWFVHLTSRCDIRKVSGMLGFPRYGTSSTDFCVVSSVRNLLIQLVYILCAPKLQFVVQKWKLWKWNRNHLPVRRHYL